MAAGDIVGGNPGDIFISSGPRALANASGHVCPVSEHRAFLRLLRVARNVTRISVTPERPFPFDVSNIRTHTRFLPIYGSRPPYVSAIPVIPIAHWSNAVSPLLLSVIIITKTRTYRERCYERTVCFSNYGIIKRFRFLILLIHCLRIWSNILFNSKKKIFWIRFV